MWFNKMDIRNNDSQGVDKIVSAFEECEEATIRMCKMKIDDGMRGDIPITYTNSKKNCWRHVYMQNILWCYEVIYAIIKFRGKLLSRGE